MLVYARHACMYGVHCSLQVSVLPLEVYNDVEQLAAPALSAQHMVAEAEADAEMCLRKLVTNLAAEVWSRPQDNSAEPPMQTCSLLFHTPPPALHTPLRMSRLIKPWPTRCSFCPLAHTCRPFLCHGSCLTPFS